MPALAQEQNTIDPEVRQQIQQIEAALTKFDEVYNKNDAAAIAALFRATQGTLRYDPISTNGPESIAAFPRENTRIGFGYPCHGLTFWIYSPRDFRK